MKFSEGREQEVVSEKDTMVITILSYQLSQGLPTLQANILEYVSGVLAKNNEVIDTNIFLGVCKKIRENMLSRMVKVGTHRDGASLSGEEGQVKDTYIPRLCMQEKTDELIPDIAKAMFLRDKRFLKEGRANPKEAGRKFLEYYGRDENSTGHVILDDLMKKVWAYRTDPKNSYEYYELGQS